MIAMKGPPSTFVPPLQRREARPTGALAFLWVLFLLPIGTCGTIGSCKLHQATTPPSAVSARQLASQSVGTYVVSDVSLTRTAHDEFPIGDDMVEVAHGYSAYAVQGAPDVLAIGHGDAKPSGVTHVDGQICDADTVAACEVPRDVSVYVRHVQDAHKSHLAILLLDERPHDRLWEALIGLGVAGVVFALPMVASALLLRVSRKPGVIAFEQRVALSRSPDDVRATLRAQANASCRVAHDAPNLVTLLLGKPLGQARLTGATDAASVPLRADIELEPGDAYRGSTGTVRIYSLWVTGGRRSEPLPAARSAIYVASGWLVEIVAR
jgi:hypothetical protein